MAGRPRGTGVSRGRTASSLASISVVLLAVVLLPPGALRPGTERQAAGDLSAYPWLYLRGGAPLAAEEHPLEVIAVGDLMLGRGVSQLSDPLGAVAPWLQAADLALGNLECVVAAGGAPRPGPYRLRAQPQVVYLLRDVGFDLLGLANNHAMDLGPAGLAEAATRLRAAGMDVVGAGSTSEAAAQPVIRVIDGIRLAFLAFNAVPDPQDGPEEMGWRPAAWDRERATAALRDARSSADAIVVSVHWGYEYDLRPDPAQRDMALALLEAGADLVLGHHPHVVQPTDIGGLHKTSDVSSDQFVAYSLGNLLFDQQQGEMRQGLALRAFFDRQGLRAVQALPIWAGLRPRLMVPGDAGSLLERVQPPPQRVAFSCAGPPMQADELCRPGEVVPSPASGPFEAGGIDLTGDGAPEQVRRVAEQIVVSEAGLEVWRGLPEWRVVDLALGDPNDDGRAEVLLALWKPDGEGVPRSHPFVVGYREGSYRILWGGSAVVDAIREVEIGDVDGDGREELVVLADRNSAAVVSVWRWHGWGFSLLWQSLPGRYSDMVLVPARAGDPLAISVAIQP